VPLKPRREGKSIAPPSSWPDDESLICWCCVYVGKTVCSRYLVYGLGVEVRVRVRVRERLG